MKKKIFYCSESKPVSDLNRCYLETEEKLVSLFKATATFRLCRIEKPEIYKHPAAFHFLDGFKPDALHLIIRRPKRIRLLKNARNILVLPETIPEAELARRAKFPFENLKRMLSLVDEIWTTRKENMERMKRAHIPSVKFFRNENVLFEKIKASS
jgi:hypothetical protein